ncbi:MAG: hypothetical protein LBR80_06945 [Deltaproteobacteria bacterium]|jgi:hypothetical protein|nr:hypothetical protein [Deltaproteobacteria bacterium]
MAEPRVYYRGQGKIFAYTRELSGSVYVPGTGVWLGNAPDFTLTMNVTKVDHRESYSGQNLVDVSYVTERTATLTATLEEFSAFNLSLCLNGKNTEVTADTGKEVIYTELNAGKTYLLGGDINVKNVVIEDSLSSPLVLNTDYTLDAPRGSFTMITTKAGGGTAEYDTDGYGLTSLFTEPDAEWWVRFEGLNMLDNNNPTVADFYKVKFNPAQNLSLISAEIAQFQLEASPLADETQPAFGDMGQFGCIKIVRGAA